MPRIHPYLRERLIPLAMFVTTMLVVVSMWAAGSRPTRAYEPPHDPIKLRADVDSAMANLIGRIEKLEKSLSGSVPGNRVLTPDETLTLQVDYARQQAAGRREKILGYINMQLVSNMHNGKANCAELWLKPRDATGHYEFEMPYESIEANFNKLPDRQDE
jgi:hypothetical protein